MQDEIGDFCGPEKAKKESKNVIEPFDFATRFTFHHFESYILF